MRQTAIAILLVFMVSSGAGPQTNTKERTPTAKRLKARIPPPKRSVYGAVRDGKDWENPYLVAMEDGVKVMKRGEDHDGPIVSVEEVMRFLEDLPKSDWSYGLVVAVQQQSVCCRYSDGEARIRANLVDLVSRLKRAGIVVSLWPSG
jgi:hypothetical protein